MIERADVNDFVAETEDVEREDVLIERADVNDDVDVLCERGAASNSNSGNSAYLRYGRALQVEYRAANRTRKKELINQVFEFVRGRGGRFLKRIEKGSNLWFEINEREAKIKIGQLLRTI